MTYRTLVRYNKNEHIFDLKLLLENRDIEKSGHAKATNYYPSIKGLIMGNSLMILKAEEKIENVIK